MYDLSGVFVEITVFIITTIIIMDIVTLWAHQGLFSFASGFGSRVWLLHHFGCMAMTFGEDNQSLQGSNHNESVDSLTFILAPQTD